MANLSDKISPLGVATSTQGTLADSALQPDGNGSALTGTAAGLTAGKVTTNANLTGAITSVGNATSLGSFTSAQLAAALTNETGSGANVFATSPTLVTPALGTPSSGIVTNLTGTASININGTVGAGTPAAGAFTSLSASGATTLSGGTANGVTYLNGSKVLTSGSALTFDGSQLDIPAGTAATPSLSTTADTNTGIFFPAADTIAFTEGGVERMRLDSAGNLGIGTSAPTQSLQIKSSGYTGLWVQSERTDPAQNIGGLQFIDSTGTAKAGVFGDVEGNLRVSSGSNTERLRITSAGNVGIGTSSPAAKLHVSNAAGTSAYAEIARLANTSLNSGTKLTFYGVQGSDASAKLSGAIGFNQTSNSDSNGQPAFIIETGNNGSITERMRIDSAGNVGIGTSSPASKLQIQNTSGNDGIRIINSTTGEGYIIFGDTADSNTGSIAYSHTDDAMTFDVNNSERLKITSAGNVGIGTSSPAYKLEVQTTAVGAAFWAQTGGTTSSYTIADFRTGTNLSALQLFGDGTSVWRGGAMRIDSAGNVGIGTSTPVSKLHITETTVDPSDSVTLLTLNHKSSGDLGAQQTFIDFSFEDTNSNETPQVRIGAVVGSNSGDANTQLLEGSGAFVVHTNNADTTEGAAGASLVERLRIDFAGNVGIGTSSPAVKLDVVGAISSTTGANFATSSGVTTAGTTTTFDIAGMGNILAFGTVSAPWPTVLGKAPTNSIGLYLAAAAHDLNNTTDMRFNVRENDNSDFTTLTSTAFDFTRWTTSLAQIKRNGNVLIGTTTTVADPGILTLSKGITFPATQVASTNANTLDDYEQGSFTPYYLSTGATWTTYFEQTGRYTKIGNLVSISGRIRSNANATGTVTNSVVIDGLPFTSMNTLGTETALAVGLQTFSTTISPAINYGTTQIVMYKSNTTDQFIASDTNGTRFFMFSGSYRVGD